MHNIQLTAEEIAAANAYEARKNAELEAARKAYPKLRHFWKDGMLNSR